jgi:hypothetical protein
MYGSSICNFVELTLLNIYLIVQDAKQEHIFYYGAWSHPPLLSTNFFQALLQTDKSWNN